MRCMLQWDSVRHAQKIHSLVMIYFLVLEFQVKSSSVEYLMPYTGMSVIFILISTDNLLRKYSNSYWLNFRGIHWSPQSLYPPTNLHPRRRQIFIEKVTFLTETKKSTNPQNYISPNKPKNKNLRKFVLNEFKRLQNNIY